MVPFLLLRAPTHHRFTFDLRFLFEMKHKVDLFKSVCRIFHFRFLCFIFIIIYVFDQQKTWKGTHSFAFKSSIFKLQKEVFFFYLGFLSCTFTIHRTAGEGGGSLFNSSVPLPPVSQTLRHQPGDYCRELTSAHIASSQTLTVNLWFPRKSL